MEKITRLTDYLEIAREHNELSKARRQTLTGTKHSIALDERIDTLSHSIYEFEESFCEEFQVRYILINLEMRHGHNQNGEVLITRQK